MSAAVDRAVLHGEESEEEFRPSPPKRGRGRGRKSRRGAATSRTTRASTAQNVRQQRSAVNVRAAARSMHQGSVINVGDIDSDEEDRPRACSPVSIPVSTSSCVRAPSPIGINSLAEVLGVTDWSPNKTSVNQYCTSSGQEQIIHIDLASSSTLNDKDIVSASSSIVNPKDIDLSSSSNLKPKDIPTDSRCSIASSLSKSNQASISTSQIQTLNRNKTDEVPAAKKTSRRGLAKKDAGLSLTALGGFSLALPNTAVYSHCVPTALLEEKTQSQVPDFSSTTDTQSPSESETVTEDEVQENLKVTGPVRSKTLKSEKSREEPVLITEVHEVHDDEEDSILELRSPSPPPQLKTVPKVTTKKHKMNKKLSNALLTINNAKGRLERLGKATPKRKARGRQSDVMIVGEEEGVVRTAMVVKVRYLSTVHRINMNLDATLHSFISQLSAICGDVRESELSLFLADQELDLSLTVRSANLSVADILDCHHIQPSSEDSIELVVQCRHSRSKTTLVINKREPLQHLLDEYTKKMGLDPDHVTLVFDGEDVDLSDSPSKLAMEDGDIVDVIVAN